MKILTIIGARPQFIKAASVSREIAKHTSLEELIIHTGQHFDENMSEVFFNEMDIPEPKINLGIAGQTHGMMTANMIAGLEPVFMEHKPDLVLVYGDTNSTLAGALAAVKLQIPIAHIEAGLRSFNLQMPEEINRILTDRISKYLFCPTTTAIKNLDNEGFRNHDCDVIFSGDVMQDSAIYYNKIADEKSTILSKLGLKKYILCTIHRAENTDDLQRLESIFEAINTLNQELDLVIPIHPRTRKIIEQKKIKCNAVLIDPVGYFDMISLIKNSELVITDSGGLQKEAFFFKKCCVTLREETEWVELVEEGFNMLAGFDKENIITSTHTMLNAHPDFNVNLYGNGHASQHIVLHLLSVLN